MKKALIFGINGFVGGYLSTELMEHGYKVYGSDLRNCDLPQNNIDFFTTDLMDLNSVDYLINKVRPDIIINLAAISSVGVSWKNPQLTMQVNVVGALNILEAIRKGNCKPKIMFIGSSEEYIPFDYPINEEVPLDSSNPYGISKVTQEYFVKLYREKFGLDIFYVRPFNHTGIGQSQSFVLPSFCKQVAEIEKSGNSGEILVGNLEIKRDFSHVKDIVRAYRMIIESDDCHVTYNIGSGSAYSLKEILGFIVRLSHQKIKIKIDERRFRPSDNNFICCDYSRIKDNLGWIPEYTVFDAIKEMYEFFLNESY